MRGVERAEVRDVIVKAFDGPDFDMFLSDKLEFNRPDEVADGPFKQVVDGVLKKFEQEGRDAHLIAHVAAVRPHKRAVQDIYDKFARALLVETGEEAEQLAVLDRYGLLPQVQLQQLGQAKALGRVSVDGFQRQVKQQLPQIDALLWATQLLKQVRRVCRIEVDGDAMGTGFLVASDVIMTNFHVLAERVQSNSSNGIECLFEYWLRPDGTTGEGVRAKLPAQDWMLDASPPLDGDVEARGTPEPNADQLDYVLFRIARKLGDEAARGWVRVPATAPTLRKDMPLSILQHPEDEPIKLALDTQALLSVNASRTRLRYATNTDPGASGSPCFDVRWGLVALHHFGDPVGKPPAYNQGIPIDAISARLVRNGKGGLLGGDPP